MDKRNVDGLRYPSIDELLDKIDSKYKLAYAAAKRAKIIKQEEDSLLVVNDEAICDKPVGIALEEILDDKVQITFADTAITENETLQQDNASAGNEFVGEE